MKRWSWYIAHLANFLSMACHMSSTLLAVYWKQEGLADWQIGWFAAGFSGAAILSRFGLGSGMERWGRRPFLISGAALMQLTIALYPYLDNQFVYWLTVRILQGFGLGIYITAILTWVADISPPDKIGQMQGVFGVSGLLGAAAGTYTFERLYLQLGFIEMFHWLFLAGVICWLLSGSLPETKPDDNDDKDDGMTLADFSFKDHLPTIVVSVPFGWVTGTIISFIGPFTKTIHMPKVGLYYAGFALASVAVRVFAARLIDVVTITVLVWVSGLLMALAGIAIACLSSYPVIGVLLTAAVFNGVGHGFLFPALSSHIVKHSGLRQRGKGLALFTGSFDVGILLGGLCSGYLSQDFGYPAAFLFGAVLMLCSLPAFQLTSVRAKVQQRKLPVL